MKQVIYIKFIDPREAELLNPTYFVGNDIETRCPKCGSILYLPIEINTGKKVEINKPMGEIFRPFPKERPDYVIRDEEPKISIGFQWLSTKKLQNPFEKAEFIETRRYLTRKYSGGGLAMIDDDGWIELQIDGISEKPVDCEACNPQPEPDLCGPNWQGFDNIESVSLPPRSLMAGLLFDTGSKVDEL